MTQIVATSHYYLATVQTEHSPAPIDALVPRELNHLPLKAIDASLASLWASLAEPRDLSTLTDAARSAALPFLHDGVFGLVGRDSIITGPVALAQLEHQSDVSPTSATARVSRGAIEMATQLPSSTSLDEIVSFLYRYQSTPVDESRRSEGLPTALLVDDWRSPHTESREETGWSMFWPRTAPKSHAHKLYVGIYPRDRHRAVAAVATALSTLGPRPFKVGYGRSGAVRPDSIVIYVESVAAAEELAQTIAEALPHVPRRPVPFTVDLAGDGLVSGGFDHSTADAENELPATSWRVEMCTSVGAALLSARAFGPARAGLTAAVLQRLVFDSVDPTTWRPETWTTNQPEDRK